MLVLLLTLAFAQDTAEAPPEDLMVLPAGTIIQPPDEPSGQLAEESFAVPLASLYLEEKITLVPEGSRLLFLGEDGTNTVRTVPGKSWLLPDSYYEEAIVKARKLAICQPALDSITEETLQMADRTYAALSKCGDQFDTDEDLIADLTGQIQSWETRALVGEDRLKQARKNTAVAWAITGGLVLGASAAMVLTAAR